MELTTVQYEKMVNLACEELSELTNYECPCSLVKSFECQADECISVKSCWKTYLIEKAGGEIVE